MHRIWAIIERDLRRFRRSPALVVVSIVMPLVQLVVLGYAFGGKIKNLQPGRRGPRPRRAGDQIAGNVPGRGRQRANVRDVYYNDQATALHDLRDGKINGVLNIPPEFSRKVLAGDQSEASLWSKTTPTNFPPPPWKAPSICCWRPTTQPAVPARLGADATLSVVEVYPYVPYIQYLLPGTIVLAIFVSAMIGGGIIFIDDKARGLHEGYLVTPIRKFELILGFNLAGAAKAIMAGVVLITLGSLIAGIPDPLNSARLARMLVLVLVTSLALISMMFLIMVRVSDPLVPRAIFGMLNTVLFFPSGAVYPTQAFPAWMKAITTVDPFTYAVHGFKQLILKNTGLAAIGGDLAYLALFTLISISAATLLFRRTL